MKDITTIDCTDVTTRAGVRIVAFVEFGHEWLEADDFWPRRGNWWVTALLDFDDGNPYEKRDIWIGDACGPKNIMDELSKDCMDYLGEKGTWNDNGVWIPNE